MQHRRIIIVILAALLLSSCQPKAPDSGPADHEPIPTATSPQPVATTETAGLPEQPTAVVPTIMPTATFSWPVDGLQAPEETAGQEFLFTLVKRVSESYQNQGIYRSQADGSGTTQILGEGFMLQEISPDGNWLLVNNGADLYLADRDGGQQVLISSAFSPQSLSSVMWAGDGSKVLWLEQAGEQKRIMTADTSSGVIEPAGGWLLDLPAAILPSKSAAAIAWIKGACNSGTACRGELLVGNLDSAMEPVSWGEVTNPLLDSGRNALVSIAQVESQIVARLTIRGEFPASIDLNMDNDIPVSYAWSPDGQTLVVIGQIRSEYSGRNYGNRVVAFRAPDWQPEMLGEIEGLNARVSFSADGRFLHLSATLPGETGYAVEVALLDLENGEMRKLDLGMDLTSGDYVFIPKLFE